jgi:hypothetical protein
MAFCALWIAPEQSLWVCRNDNSWLIPTPASMQREVVFSICCLLFRMVHPVENFSCRFLSFQIWWTRRGSNPGPLRARQMCSHYTTRPKFISADCLFPVSKQGANDPTARYVPIRTVFAPAEFLKSTEISTRSQVLFGRLDVFSVLSQFARAG